MICNKNNRKIDGIQWIDLCLRIIEGLIERKQHCVYFQLYYLRSPVSCSFEQLKEVLQCLKPGMIQIEITYDNLLALE